MKVLYHISGAITFVNEIPWVVEPIYLAQVCYSLHVAAHRSYEVLYIVYNQLITAHPFSFTLDDS